MSNQIFYRMVKDYNPKYKRNKSKEKFEKLKSEIKENFDKQHTFKPNVNWTNIFANQPEKYNESKQELYKRLSTPKIIQLNKRQKEKDETENQKLRSECTFKPIIKPLIDVQTTEKVETRLFKLAEQMREKREKLKRDFQDDLIKDLSFQPSIDLNSKQLLRKYENPRPIHERYEEVIKIKNKNLQNIRNQMEKKERSKHRPVINSKSKEILLRKTDRSFDENTFDRLYRQGLTRCRGRSIGNEEDKECTFAPNLCYSTINGGNIEDFLERQKLYEDLKKERLERKLSKSIESNQYTFKPKINLTSDLLMKTDLSRAGEEIKDKVERLYKDNYEKLKNRREQLESLYYAQYDFKPKINEISRYVGKDHTIDDLYQKKESEKTKRNKDYDDEQYTFKPKINKDKFENIQSNYKLDQNILDRIQGELKFKNEKIEEIKM
jgi:hypothetical protein